MLLFFSIILIFFIILLILLLSDIKFTLDEFKILYNESSGNYFKKYNGRLGLYFLGKVRLLNIKISDNSINLNSVNSFIKKVIKQDKIKEQFKLIKKNNKKENSLTNIIRVLIKNGKIEKFITTIYIGVSNVLATSYLVGIISIILPSLIQSNIKKFKADNYFFKIKPVYNKNYVYIKLNFVISLKIVHIINSFIISNKKRIHEKWF